MTSEKMKFAKELKFRVEKKQSITEIGAWAHRVYLEYSDVNDKIFLRSLLALGSMELGADFYYTYEELNKIADDLISGKEIDLNPD